TRIAWGTSFFAHSGKRVSGVKMPLSLPISRKRDKLTTDVVFSRRKTRTTSAERLILWLLGFPCQCRAEVARSRFGDRGLTDQDQAAVAPDFPLKAEQAAVVRFHDDQPAIPDLVDAAAVQRPRLQPVAVRGHRRQANPVLKASRQVHQPLPAEFGE